MWAPSVPADPRAPEAERRAQRRVAAVQSAAGLLVLGVLVVALIPWGSAGTGAMVRPEGLFTPEQLDEAESYARAARAWSWSSLAVSLLAAAALGFTRLGARCVDCWAGHWWARVVLAAVTWVSVQALATLGFRVGSWQLRREVGLSTQEWGGFLRDTAVSWTLEALSLTVLVLVLVGLSRQFTRTWTVVAGAVLAATVVLVSYVYPTTVEPLFHDFTALPQGELREEITRTAVDEDVSVEDVVVADASRRTTTLNAWVSGFGDTRRVVLYDSLVEEVPQDEVLVVVAHELAHARHGDVLVGTVLGAVGAFAAVGALGWVAGRRKAVDIRQPRVVPLILALLTFGTQAMAPIENAISREVESRADSAALCATQDEEAFEAIQLRLDARSLSDPTPPRWSHLWWGSHPTLVERVALARGDRAAWCEAAGVSRSLEPQR